MFKLFNPTSFAAYLAFALLSVATAHADLIVNGSFENGTFSACSIGDYCQLNNGSTNLTGWTIGGVGVDWHNSVEMQLPHTGDKVIDLNLDGNGTGSGTISQTFATTVGQQYLLKFFLAGPEPGPNFGFADPRVVSVSIAGLNTTFSTPASLNTNIQWAQEQLYFTAASSSTTLSFASPSDSAFWGPVLDDVSVEAVPEPSSLFCVTGALLGFAIRLRHARP